MKKSIIVAASVLVIVLVGCTETNKPSTDKASEIVSRLTYVKDSHGICYATIGSYTYGGSIVVSITAVPCNLVKDLASTKEDENVCKQ